MPNGFGFDLFKVSIFFQDQGTKRRNSGVITRLCNAEIEKTGSNKRSNSSDLGIHSEILMLNLWA